MNTDRDEMVLSATAGPYLTDWTDARPLVRTRGGTDPGVEVVMYFEGQVCDGSLILLEARGNWPRRLEANSIYGYVDLFWVMPGATGDAESAVVRCWCVRPGSDAMGGVLWLRSTTPSDVAMGQLMVIAYTRAHLAYFRERSAA